MNTQRSAPTAEVPGDRLCDQQEALAKVAFAAARRLPGASHRKASNTPSRSPMAVRLREGADEGSRLSGTDSRPTCGRPTITRRRRRSRSSATAATDRHSHQDHIARAGQRVEKVESWQDRRPPRAPLLIGWSTSTGNGLGRVVALQRSSRQTLQYRVQERGDADIRGAARPTVRKKRSSTKTRGNDLDGCALGASGRREAAVCKQQEAQRGLRDSGCVVQLHEVDRNPERGGGGARPAATGFARTS